LSFPNKWQKGSLCHVYFSWLVTGPFYFSYPPPKWRYFWILAEGSAGQCLYLLGGEESEHFIYCFLEVVIHPNLCACNSLIKETSELPCILDILVDDESHSAWYFLTGKKSESGCLLDFFLLSVVILYPLYGDKSDFSWFLNDNKTTYFDCIGSDSCHSHRQDITEWLESLILDVLRNDDALELSLLDYTDSDIEYLGVFLGGDGSESLHCLWFLLILSSLFPWISQWKGLIFFQSSSFSWWWCVRVILHSRFLRDDKSEWYLFFLVVRHNILFQCWYWFFCFILTFGRR